MLNLILGAAEPGAVADGHLAKAAEWAGGAAASTPYVPVTPGARRTQRGAEAWLARQRLRARPTPG